LNRKSEVKKSNSGGGSATGGGINFQAAVSSIVAVHILDGSKLGWLDGIHDDIPIQVSAETNGPGDDVRIRYSDESICEVQVKKGLSKSKKLWTTLESLAAAIDGCSIAYGILVVCSETSGTIRRDLSRDIIRIGGGRTDGLKPISKEFLEKLDAKGIDTKIVCSKLRVVVVPALTSDSAGVQLAKSKIRAFCVDESEANHAWGHLLNDAAKLIEYRGKRDAVSLRDVLKSNAIQLEELGHKSTPINLLEKIAAWSESIHQNYTVFGIDQAISIDDAWMPIKSIVQDREHVEHDDVTKAIETYHAWSEKADTRNSDEIDPTTLGLYFKCCVIVAGPGMGKTTLLKKLFRLYNAKNQPAVFVRLPHVAARMDMYGDSFQEAVFNLGLDGVDISSKEALDSNIRNWTFLLDGLDECGVYQTRICEALLKYQSGFSESRIILSTRPIGYSTPLLSEWRHYELLPLDKDNARSSVELILSNLFPTDSDRAYELIKFFDAEVEGNKYSNVLLRSPLLLGLSTSLAIKKIEFGNTKTELYRSLFKLIEDDSTVRQVESEVERSTLEFFLSCLGWILNRYPVQDLEATINSMKVLLSKELECKELKAAQILNKCLDHWEEKGVIERIRHAGGDFLTFIHKTFSEYWAGRYLAQLSHEDLKAELEGIKESNSLNEVLVFAGSLGVSDQISKRLLTDWESAQGDHQILFYLLDIIGVSELPPAQEIRSQVFKYSVQELLSLDRQHVFKFAARLATCCEVFSTEVTKYSNKHIGHEQYSTQLACVTLSLMSEQYVLTVEEQINFFLDFFDRRKNYEYSSLSGGFLGFGSDGWFKLKKEFVGNSVEFVIKKCSDEKQLEVFSKTIFNKKNLSLSIIRKVERIFNKTAHEKHLDRLYQGTSFNSTFLKQFDSEAFKKKEANAIKALCGLLIDADEIVENSSSQVLYDLSAFLCGANYWKSNFKDILATLDEEHLDGIREVFKGLVKACNMSKNGLNQDASTLLASIDEGKLDTTFILLDRTTFIDIAPDWKRTDGYGLNIELVEQAMYCDAGWILWMAGSLLIEHHSQESLVSVIKRLLNTGGYKTLRTVAQMIPFLESKTLMRQVIVDRLKGTLVAGCQYLYKGLSELELELELDDDLIEVIRRGLLESGPLTATEAAKLLSKHIGTSTESFYELLEDAYIHWSENEEPYPVGSGAIPPSPRDEILSMMIESSQPDANALIKYLADTRSDVQGVARKNLLTRLDKETLLFRHFIDALNSELIAPSNLDSAIRECDFDDNQNEAICELIEHRKPKVRFSAIKILKNEDIPTFTRDSWLKLATKDKDEEVREAALQMASQFQNVK